MIASPDIAAVALLRSEPVIAAATGGRVSTDLQPGSPSVRVTLLPGGEAFTEFLWEGMVQVDVWAEDQLEAAQAAALIRAAWPCYRGRTLSELGVYVSGCWVQSNPSFMLDPETGLPRYMMTLGVMIHDAS